MSTLAKKAKDQFSRAIEMSQDCEVLLEVDLEELRNTWSKQVKSEICRATQWRGTSEGSSDVKLGGTSNE